MTDLEQLEKRVERDRAALARSLDTLTDTLSTETIASEVSATLQGYGGELGNQAMKAAKENPAAFALVGAGLALLLSGAGQHTRPTATARPSDTAMAGFDARVAKADRKIKATMSGTTLSPTALRLRSAMDSGLDKLPANARSRVLRARQAALEAQERVEEQARKAAKGIQKTHHQQPLITGALAFGLGAIAAAFLPSTRQEDEMLGERRDALMAEAQRAMSEEMQKLSASASNAMDEIASKTAAQ
ncbi:MAG: hypothetical protein ACU0GG_12290 [Paracoccaceae bacterium]